VHQGAHPTVAGGDVVLDSLPAPVIGTFWASAAAGGPKLASVVGGQRRVVIERTALTLAELIEGNPDTEVTVTEVDGTRYTASIMGMPMRTTEELAATSPPHAPVRLGEKSQLVLLKTAEGTKVVPLDRLRDLVFRHPPKEKSGQEEFRQSLTLRLDWGDRAPEPSTEVGLMYVQKGIRWIPSYRIDLGEDGQATVRLQATVLNELTDLSDTTVQLVIGVPAFYFKDTVDPMALQQTAVQLSQFFQSDAAGGRHSVLANNFDNRLMTQVARAGEYDAGQGPGAGTMLDDLPEGSQQEDLYVFTVPGVTLAKGERVVLSLAEMSLPYEDVYTLQLPIAPPADLRQHFNSQQQAELAKLFHASKVAHKVRLKNQSTIPFTTAPALVLQAGRVLAQGLMTYAAPGGSAEVTLNPALDIAVHKTDRESSRTPNAISFNRSNFLRINLDGTIRLTNHKSTAVTVEVTRHALGHIDSATNDGKVEMANVFEGVDFAANPGGDPAPTWWHWHGWPAWWNQVNGIGRVVWEVAIDPGKSVELGYKWHYFWQ